MRRHFFLCLFFGLLLCQQAAAQVGRRSHRGAVLAPPDSAAIVAARYAHALDSLTRSSREAVHDTDDVPEDPYFFPVLAGSTLYSAPLRMQIGTVGPASVGMSEEVARFLADVYVARPDLVERILPEAASEKAASPVSVPAVQPPLPEITKVPAPKPTARMWKDEGTLDLHVERPNFWTFKGNFSLQFMQYYVTDNWYKGGEDHNSLLATLNAEANYDNKEKLTFSNRLEMKLGFQSSQSDTQHEYKTNADLLRLTNKLGLQAAKRWYYTVMLQSWTQFYPGYHANDPKVYSDFMSPFESVLSVGMDYKYKKGSFEISATLSPIAADFKYVDRPALARRYGLDAGKHTKLDLGSTVTVNAKWSPIAGLVWTTRFYAFTSYSRFQAEWENTLALKVNKYLSTKIFLFPRFDDGVKRKAGQSFFQFNEYLSVGLDLGF